MGPKLIVIYENFFYQIKISKFSKNFKNDSYNFLKQILDTFFRKKSKNIKKSTKIEKIQKNCQQHSKQVSISRVLF